MRWVSHTTLGKFGGKFWKEGGKEEKGREREKEEEREKRNKEKREQRTFFSCHFLKPLKFVLVYQNGNFFGEK